MFKKLIASHEQQRRIAWIIFALLVLPFAIFGVSTRWTGRPAGSVFGRSVPAEEFEAERAWLLRQLRAQFGNTSDALDALQGFVIQTTWDRIILAEEAKRRRLRVTDRELADFLQQIPALQSDGRFDPERYQQYLRATGATSQEFERLLRQDLAVERLVNAVKSSVSVSNEQVRDAYRRAREQRTAVVIFFDINRFTAEASSNLTEEAIRAGFDAHQEEYRVPEQLTFEYAGVPKEQLQVTEEPGDQELDAFYHDHPEMWPKTAEGAPKPLDEVKTQVRQHWLAERTAKRRTMASLDLQDDLDAKRSFDDIVASRTLTRQTAGPLSPNDVWTSGGPEPALLHAADKLAEGEVSPVIQTDQGVYLVRLTKRLPAHVPPFEEVRERVRQQVIRARAKELARARAGAVHDELAAALAKGLRFEEAVIGADRALPVSSFSFTRTGAIGPMGAVAAANEAAFAAPLGSITEVLEAPDGFAILRPEAVIPADFSAFAEAQAGLRTHVLEAQQRDRLNQWLGELRARARLKSFVEPASAG